MPRKISEEQILLIASKREFVVNKYKWSSENIRRLTRKMLKDGKLVLVRFDGEQFYYRAAKVKNA